MQKIGSDKFKSKIAKIKLNTLGFWGFGDDLGVTRAVSEVVNIPVIASGGVGNLAGEGRQSANWSLMPRM